MAEIINFEGTKEEIEEIADKLDMSEEIVNPAFIDGEPSVMTINQFSIYYKQQIENLRIKLATTISKFLSTRATSIVKINVIKSGTCISYVNEKVRNGNFIDYQENICLNIGYEEVLYMYRNCSFNLFEAFNKLVTHEFLHVLFGDFDKSKLCKCYNYSIGAIDENKLENDSFYVRKPENKFDRNGAEKLNHLIYNYASDFVINRELDIVKPFLRAEDFGLDPDLNVFQYYAILSNPDFDINIMSGVAIEMEGSGDSSKSESSGASNKPSKNGKSIVDVVGEYIEENPEVFSEEDFSGVNNGMENVPISNEKMSQVTDEELLEDLFLGKSRGLGPGNIDFIVKKLKKKKSIFIDQTKEIINEIKNDLFNNQDTPTGKIESWLKFNNRREQNGFVLPGKISERDPNSKVLEKRSIPIIFIDCSGSMMDILKELFYFCYNILSYINCTIVFYDTNILKVISSANSLNFDPSMFLGGGTSVKNAIEEYKKDYNDKINNVYVFTDGYDDFDNIDVAYLSVFGFSKTGIRKIR